MISAARPKIADYPFTTLEPNLGVVRLDDATEFVVADIPGLIEGASEGRGLGHQFLRHIERARVLCLLVDLASLDGTSPADQERILLDELGAYRPDLLDRPRLVVGTKADITGSIDPAELGFDLDRPVRSLEHSLGSQNGEDRFVISAVTRDGLGPLVGAMASARARGRVRGCRTSTAWCCCARSRPAPPSSAMGEHEFRLRGRDVERVVALNDITSSEAVAYISHRLDRLGVNRAARPRRRRRWRRRVDRRRSASSTRT